MNNVVLKKAIIKVIGVAGIAACSSFLHAASFDCAKAAAPIEKLICSDETVSKLDADLAGAYKAAMEKTDNKDAFKQQQRNWLKEKRNACKDAACLTHVYQARIAELANLSTSVVDNKVYDQAEVDNKKFITFTLVEGDGYPLCKEYVEMLNKTQYTEMPVCSRKILPEVKNFQEIAWVEITDKEEMIKVTKERMAIQQALNPTHSKQMYDPVNRIKLINENRLKMYSYKIQINDDGVMDVIYRNHSHPQNDRQQFGHCETVDSFFINDSKINLQSVAPYAQDPYRTFNIGGSRELFMYGGNLYVSTYKGKTYHRTNIEVYGIGNKKMCGILAK